MQSLMSLMYSFLQRTFKISVMCALKFKTSTLYKLRAFISKSHLDTSTCKYCYSTPKLYFKCKSVLTLFKLAPHPKFIYVSLISLGHETEISTDVKRMGFESRLPGLKFLLKLYFLYEFVSSPIKKKKY